MFPLSIILAHHVKDCGDMPLHDLGSRYTTNLEQQTITAQRTLDKIKEEMYIHPSVSLSSCTQLLGLECRFLEDGMGIVLNHAM